MDDLEKHKRLSRRAAMGVGAGVVLAVLNAIYLSNQLPYFTATSRPFVYAIYIVAIALLLIGGHAWRQARALAATLGTPE
jgi:hypothetical protein